MSASIFLNMRLLTTLPQLFKTGNLIIRSLQDGIDANEMKAIVAEVRTTIKSVPELGAFLGIFDSLVKVAAVVLPTFLGDKAKLIALGLEQSQVEEAIAVTHLMKTIIDEAVNEGTSAAKKVSDSDIEGMI